VAALSRCPWTVPSTYYGGSLSKQPLSWKTTSKWFWYLYSSKNIIVRPYIIIIVAVIIIYLLFVYFSTRSTAHIIKRWRAAWLRNDELEAIWKETIVAYYAGIHMKGLSNTTKNRSRNIRSLGRDLNSRLPEQETMYWPLDREVWLCC
jgi:heme/copper-type cytochrome/quinol oxidase subunit 2